MSIGVLIPGIVAALGAMLGGLVFGAGAGTLALLYVGGGISGVVLTACMILLAPQQAQAPGAEPAASG